VKGSWHKKSNFISYKSKELDYLRERYYVVPERRGRLEKEL
jgi:hypothetical protein